MNSNFVDETTLEVDLVWHSMLTNKSSRTWAVLFLICAMPLTSFVIPPSLKLRRVQPQRRGSNYLYISTPSKCEIWYLHLSYLKIITLCTLSLFPLRCIHQQGAVKRKRRRRDKSEKKKSSKRLGHSRYQESYLRHGTASTHPQHVAVCQPVPMDLHLRWCCLNWRCGWRRCEHGLVFLTW